jgi:hypothetical protein
MKLQLIPILDQMEALYQLPRNRKRFEVYLKMLQGDTKDDMVLPIGGYNPMGKELVLEKLQELKALEAEAIVEEECQIINQILGINNDLEFGVAINLSDDVGGAWSNHFAVNYSSKFELNPLVKRNFCTPYFWTSETYTETLIRERIQAYVYRTVFFIQNGRLRLLKDFLAQEVFVQQHLKIKSPSNFDDFEFLELFYEEYAESDDYSTIFNFFFGDEASEVLGYSTFGMRKNDGFEYAKVISDR